MIDQLYLSQQKKTLDHKKDLCLPNIGEYRVPDSTECEGETLQLAMNLIDNLQRSSKKGNNFYHT
jgi:hypothetical protein